MPRPANIDRKDLLAAALIVALAVVGFLLFAYWMVAHPDLARLAAKHAAR
jgi:hypothetical protein